MSKKESRSAAQPQAFRDEPLASLWARRRWLAAAGALALAGCGGGGSSNDGPLPASVAPSLDIRGDVLGDARGVFTVTFFFSDAVLLPSGTLAFSLSGGSTEAGSFTRLNDRTFSVRIRPNASAQGLIDLRVPPGAYRDVDGRVSNTVTYVFTQPYDTLPPAVTLRFGGPVNALGFITGPGLVTLSFSGALDTALTSNPLTISPGSASAFTRTSAAGQPDVYTFQYTPPPNTTGVVGFDLPANSVRRNGIGNRDEFWNFGLATGP